MSELHERVAALEADQGTMTSDIADIKKDVKEVLAYINQARGWAAAMLLLSGALGGLVGAIFK